ncbi:MAG: hypothetical protein QOD06_2146 [Candidatus Binatota bacterium]|nr:hypothetical protein [Candidatus Binatota bacterium]
MCRRIVSIAAFLFVTIARTTVFAAITYPAGTTLEKVWMSPPKISSERGVEILSSRLLKAQREGEEVEFGAEEMEAFKFLFDPSRATVREDPKGRTYVYELSPATMTSAQSLFHQKLTRSLADGLGARTASTWVDCIGYRFFMRLKLILRFTSQIDIWGMAAFGVNFHYGTNNSDLIYGFYPFGFQVGYWKALKCVLDAGGLPSQEEFQSCGRTKQWMLQGPSILTLSSMTGHVVPGVAQASLMYAGALASGDADEFRTSFQYRASGDATWLLGPSHTPLPSSVHLFTTASGSPGTNYHYNLSMVVSWFPTIALNAAYNNPVRYRNEVYTYDGRGDGNPHSLGNFFAREPLSRHHEPLACD